MQYFLAYSKQTWAYCTVVAMFAYETNKQQVPPQNTRGPSEAVFCPVSQWLVC